MIILVLISIITLLTLYAFVYRFYKERFSFWENKGVPSLEPSIPFGDFANPLKRTPTSVQCAGFYRIFKERDQIHGGIYIFSRPVYLPIDPELIKNVLIKDFDHFNGRGVYFNEKDQPILGNLFFVEGERWKNLRIKLTQMFTSGKMKMMFGTMLNCTGPLVNKFEEMAVSGEVIDIKDVLARFTTDVIGSCAFGIECNSFESPNSDFRKYGRKIFEESIFKFAKTLLAFAFQDVAKKLGVTLLGKDVEEFFTKMAVETYTYRKKNDVYRNDFLQLLIELKDKESGNGKADALTMDELVAQVFVFFNAGFDTSSATLTFCLFELSSNVSIQNKLRSEIKKVLKEHGGEMTYDAINDMKYMDQVINETMRKYPLVALMPRICTETYRIPSSDIIIDKGTSVFIPILGLHRDPDYYPDPEKFDPERFSERNTATIVPGTYLPFGAGPRTCIGLRFGLMQVKVGLATLLRDFEFGLNAKTKVPLELDLGFITIAKGGVWLNCKKVP